MAEEKEIRFSQPEISNFSTYKGSYTETLNESGFNQIIKAEYGDSINRGVKVVISGADMPTDKYKSLVLVEFFTIKRPNDEPGDLQAYQSGKFSYSLSVNIPRFSEQEPTHAYQCTYIDSAGTAHLQPDLSEQFLQLSILVMAKKLLNNAHRKLDLDEAKMTLQIEDQQALKSLIHMARNPEKHAVIIDGGKPGDSALEGWMEEPTENVTEPEDESGECHDDKEGTEGWTYEYDGHKQNDDQ